MKYLCKVNCFRDGTYYKAGKVYDGPADWKPPVSKVHGPMFEVVDPSTLQLSQKEEIAALREQVAEMQAKLEPPKRDRPQKEEKSSK